MAKKGKITYKTYLNDRLKKVDFHGFISHPLYVQATFERRTIFFKSRYFELFSKPLYTLLTAGEASGPTLEQVIAEESKLIEFVISKMDSNISLERFKDQYSFYGADLCEMTEPDFVNYLFTFFQDKGLPALASVLKEGCKTEHAFHLVRDMKTVCNKAIYDELVENSTHYAPPYLPLFRFMLETKKWPIMSLSLMDLECEKTYKDFDTFLKLNYPTHAIEISRQVDQWTAHLNKPN